LWARRQNVQVESVKADTNASVFAGDLVFVVPAGTQPFFDHNKKYDWVRKPSRIDLKLTNEIQIEFVAAARFQGCPYSKRPLRINVRQELGDWTFLRPKPVRHRPIALLYPRILSFTELQLPTDAIKKIIQLR